MKNRVLIKIFFVLLLAGAAVAMSGCGGEKQAVDKAAELAYYIPGDHFVTNVSGSKMLLKANVSLGFDKKAVDTAVLKERNSEIRDVIIRELRMLTEEDVASPEILDELKGRLFAALKEDLEFSDLQDIRITDFVAQ